MIKTLALGSVCLGNDARWAASLLSSLASRNKELIMTQYSISRYFKDKWNWSWYSFKDVPKDQVAEYIYWEDKFVELYWQFYSFFSRYGQVGIASYLYKDNKKLYKNKILDINILINDRYRLAKLFDFSLDSLSQDDLKFIFRYSLRDFCSISLLDIKSGSVFEKTDEGFWFLLEINTKKYTPFDIIMHDNDLIIEEYKY